MKTLIKALLGASMLMPIAAQAQDRNDGDHPHHSEARRDGGQRPQHAQQQQQQRPQQVQPQQQPQAAQAQQARERGGNRADWRNAPPPQARAQEQAQFQARQQQQAQFQAQTQNGAQAQAQAGGFRQDRRGDRQDPRAGGMTPGQYQNDARNGQGYRQDGRDDQRRRDQQLNRNGVDWRDQGRQAGGFDDRRGWNRGWRTDNRYDWNHYRAANRGAYRLPRYYAPYGWGYGYRRFSIGITLSSVLWAEDYWIDDPYSYRLPEAYGPYRWVRYYDDALLVDIRSGQVVDTVYGIFD